MLEEGARSQDVSGMLAWRRRWCGWREVLNRKGGFFSVFTAQRGDLCGWGLVECMSVSVCVCVSALGQGERKGEVGESGKWAATCIMASVSQ